MSFSARVVQILLLLIDAHSPIPAQDLADQLELSKRTIFRELKHLDKELSRYGIKLDTKSKRGIFIEGTEENKAELLDALSQQDYNDPRNIEQRRNRLILELLKQEEIQKIYYYSSLLKVSEATIHSDLDAIEQWFSESELTLVRKAGIGVYLEYEEENYRRACMRYIYQWPEDPMPLARELVEDAVSVKVKQALSELPNNRVSRMTESSYLEFVLYLSIMTKRILMGKQNSQSKAVDLEGNSVKDYQYVIELCSILSQKFQLSYNTTEIANLFIYIRGSKLQYMNAMDAVLENEPSLTYLIYEMINHYDSSIAHLLKQDKDLIKGLITHLKPTIVRLKNKIQIQNPLQSQIKALYPLIYQKSQQASMVIEEQLTVQLPEEEIGLLAIHFGSAEVKLKRLIKLNRKVCIGVVCPGGIGISTLISSRIVHAFYDEVRVTTFSYNDVLTNKVDGIDIMISTFKIDHSTVKTIQVDPMLPQEDIEAIAKAIESVSKQTLIEASSSDGNTIESIVEIGLVAKEIESILESFNVFTVKDTLNMDELMLFIEQTLGTESEHFIYKDLKRREEIATQVIPDLEIAFLHAKTKGVKNSKFILIKPDSACFRDPYYSKARIVIVMLIPEEDPRTTLVISCISIAMFDDTLFLDEVKNGNADVVRHYIERVMKEYLKEQIMNS